MIVALGQRLYPAALDQAVLCPFWGTEPVGTRLPGPGLAEGSHLLTCTRTRAGFTPGGFPRPVVITIDGNRFLPVRRILLTRLLLCILTRGSNT